MAARVWRCTLWICTLALGCGAVAWGATLFPRFWQESFIESLARRIEAGEPYNAQILAGLRPELAAIEDAAQCRPAAVEAAAIIRLRMVEEAITRGERATIDARMTDLRRSIHVSLACSPADPLLWTALFWLESTQNGFRPEYLEYLRMSYRLGPNEGPTGLKRNGRALALYEQLPPDLAEAALDEFAHLLDAGYEGEMVQVFTGPGWHVRSLILPRLRTVAALHRQAFEWQLHGQGYDVPVPGVARRLPRPWN